VEGTVTIISGDEGAGVDLLSGVGRWLSDCRPDITEVRLMAVGRSETNGFSNRTLFGTFEWSEAGAPVRRELVLRAPPERGGVFPDYDLAKQARVLEALSLTGFPVPVVIGSETDPSYLGCPFLVMARAHGRVPSDEEPQYHSSGWLHDATPAQQQTLFESFHDRLAELATVDWQALGLHGAARSGDVGLRAELDWTQYFLEWATDGAPPSELGDLLAWCRQHQPEPEPPPVLSWGDARFGNVIFDEVFGVRAMLDWEQVCIGPAELDLGWSFATRRVQQTAHGLPVDQELPGFLPRAETIARYERRIGRPVQHLAWYEVFAILRVAICLARLQHLLRQHGVTEHFIFDLPYVQPWVEERRREVEIPA
jgi:aminoglycoside phosphotransferase (APT) family kinase protein